MHIHELSEVSNDRQSIDGLLSNGIENLIRLNSNYSNASLAEARDLIGLIYPENFTIRGEQVQTTRINKVIESIYMINSELSLKKNGTKESFFSLSRKVTLTGFKPVTSWAVIKCAIQLRHKAFCFSQHIYYDVIAGAKIEINV